MGFQSYPLLQNQFGNYNYLLNGNFDRLDAFSAQSTGAQSWNQYKNTAGTTPVNGTGGSPTVIQNAVISSGQLRGLKSWQLSKTGNAQGEGYSSDFTIDTADQNKQMSISFDFSAGSAYTAGDMVVFIYDITNSTLITPSVTAIPQNSGSFSSSFATTSSSSYRLIIHCAATNSTTTNWTLTLDNMRVTNLVPQVGTPLNDWNDSLTWTFAGLGTTSGADFWTRRVGDSMEVRGRVVCGTTTATPLKISLPSGYVLDSTKLNTNASGFTVGYMWRNASSTFANTSSGPWPVFFDGSATDGVFAGKSSGVTAFNKDNASTMVSVGDVLNFIFTIPISTWASTSNFASNQIEWASNSSTADTNDFTSFVNGPNGSTFPGALTANRRKRVRFQNAIQPSDLILIEIQTTSGGPWTPVPDNVFGVSQFEVQNTTAYGMGYTANVGVSTDIDINFGHYSYTSGSSYASAGNDWSTSGGRWRVRKSSGPNAIEMKGAASPTTYTDAQATALGFKEYAHGTNYNGGNAPTVTSSVGGFTATKGEFYPYQDQAGTWYMRIEIQGDYTGNSHSTANLTINGATFANEGNNGWALAMGQGNNTTTYPIYAYAARNTSVVGYQLSAAVSGLSMFITGWAKLASKPTWAY